MITALALDANPIDVAATTAATANCFTNCFGNIVNLHSCLCADSFHKICATPHSPQSANQKKGPPNGQPLKAN